MIDIAEIMGKMEHLRILTFSEYNPAIEKFKSGAALA